MINMGKYWRLFPCGVLKNSYAKNKNYNIVGLMKYVDLTYDN